jgi:hypothetical protein
MDTAIDPKNPEANEVLLTQQQIAALPLLAVGAKKKDAAAAVGVCAQTVSSWLSQPHFNAALVTKRDELTASAAARLRDATEAAVDSIVALITSGSENARLKAAIFVLERVLALDCPHANSETSDPTVDDVALLASLGVNVK